MEQNVGCEEAGSSRVDLAAALLEGVAEGVYVTDLGGAIREFNASAEVLTGRSSGEVVGGPCSQALGCEDPSSCPLGRLASGRVWVEGVCRGARADGRPLAVRLRARTLWDRAGRVAGVVGVFSDASAQESLQRKLVAYERLASLGELATSLVHEVGNPVGVILGFARLLVQEEGKDPDGELRDRIYREAERCREIVGQLLDYARSSRHSPRPIPLNLADVARETVHLLSYRMRRQGVRCEFEWDPAVPLVEADPGEMKQVLVNVLLNAVDAMASGGTIRVTGAPVERETATGGDSLLSPRVETRREAWVEVRVEDEGEGLGAVDPERFFEPFYTTKEKGGGLGLPVCRRLVAERGGEVTLANREGGGACAVIRLPAWSG